MDMRAGLPMTLPPTQAMENAMVAATEDGQSLDLRIGIAALFNWIYVMDVQRTHTAAD